MSKTKCESVYSTEDEDSRDTVVESEINYEQSDETKRIHDSVTKFKIADRVTAAQFINNNAPRAGNLNRIPNGKLVLIKKNDKLYKIVLPHNVMPTTGCAGGPVVINIPEVGPLVIKIDPKVKKQQTVKPSTELERFAVNFDDLVEKASIGDIMEERPVPKRARTFTEKPFYCWTNVSARTRSKNTSFTGFSKKECTNTKKCLNQLQSALLKRTWQLDEIKNQYCQPSNEGGSSLISKNVVVLLEDMEKPSGLKKKKRSRKKRLRSRTGSESLRKQGKKLLSEHKNQYTVCSEQKVTSSESNVETKYKLLSYLIEDERKFAKEMSFSKPFLIINEQQFPAMNFTMESNKCNIVYLVGKDRNIAEKLAECSRFSNAVHNGYVKLVDSDVFCDYLNPKVK